MYKRLDFNKYRNCINYVEKRDEQSNCNYILTTVRRFINSNERVFPRVRTTYGNGDNISLYEYMDKEEVLFAINAGIFNTRTGKPECLLINNKKNY